MTSTGPDGQPLQRGTEFRREVVAGLTSDPKTLPTRFLYDARGSDLFEQITRLESYYPTRTEIGILRRAAAEWLASLPPDTVLVEFGSGSSIKTEILLEATNRITIYVPIDVSPTALDAAADRLGTRFPSIEIVPIVADFTKPAAQPAWLAEKTCVGFFPGSTIGNFEPDAARKLLRNFADLLGRRGRLLIGVDLKKDRSRLEAAYDDPDGVTAEFNLNLLRRIKQELGARIDIEAFEHLAVYNEAKSRVEMHLVSKCDQTIEVCGEIINLEAGERIHTENSHKYSREDFAALADAAGWRVEKVWADSDDLFSVQSLRVA